MQLEVYNSKYNPEATFKSRKKMYEILEKSQLREHGIIETMSNKSTETKKNILEILSKWLAKIEIRVEHTSIASEIREMSKISNLDMKVWIELQKEGINLYHSYINDAKTLQKSKNDYEKIAPYGFVSGWFKDKKEEEERLIQKSIVEKLRAKANLSEETYSNNVVKRQNFAEKFFRNCLSNMKELRESLSVGKLISEELVKLEQVMATNWNQLLNEQQDVNRILADEIFILKSNY